MKKLLPLFCVALISCTISKSTLKGKYQDTPFQIETSKSFEETWSKLIDLFAQKGLSIKIIDKSSGLITSEKTSFLSSFTYEDALGKPINPNAFVVSAKTSFMGTAYPPQSLTGEWNVRIKQGDGKTIINVNLVNLTGQYVMAATRYGGQTTGEIDAKSTGVFEKLIADQIR